MKKCKIQVNLIFFPGFRLFLKTRQIISMFRLQVGLQARLTQLEQENIALRTDYRRQELACDSAKSAKESAQKVIDEREQQIAELHEDLAKKEQIIEDQRREIQQLIETITGRETTEVHSVICYFASCSFFLYFHLCPLAPPPPS